MSTARKMRPSIALSSAYLAASLWGRLGAALKAALIRIPASSATPAETPALAQRAALPVPGKIAAISAAGVFSSPVRKASSRAAALPPSTRAARRPGMQNRWKATDRVAI